MLFCCLDDLETADFITEEEKKLSGTTVIILIAFVFYLAMMIVIGAVYMKKTSSSEDYFLGGRGLNGWVAALSAQASDMSGWLLMGLPGGVYALGTGQSWIAIGLFLGTVVNWLVISGPLRRYTIRANNSLTLPTYFENRFHDKKKVLLLISSITAAAVALTIRGFDPIIAISLTPDDAFRLNQIPLFVLLGIFCGLMSYYFTTVNARVGAFFKKIDSPYKKWLIGGAVLGILIYIFPPLYGEGYEGFMSLMHGNTTELFNNSLFYRFSQIDWVVILFIVGTMFFKVIAMASTNAAGGVGGTFAPSLFVGAFMGAITALVCNTLFGWNLSLVSFTLVGMAGVMSGVMKAPLTSIFLIAELSSGYGLFIPLMITACIAFAIDYYLDPDSIYTKQLRQNGELITHNKDESVFVFLRLDDLIQDDGVYIHPSQTLGDIVQIMSRERHDDYFPVLDNEKHLLGIVRLNDVREDLFNPQKYGNPITRYMLLSPDTILQHEQIQSVLRRFDENHVWVLPVVDKEKHYLGYISKSRIMTAYREQLVKISQ